MSQKKWFILAAIILTITTVGYFYYQYSNSPTTDWEKHFSQEEAAPYGTQLLYKLLKSRNTFVTIDQPLPNFKKFENIKNSGNAYVFVGHTFFPDKITTGLLQKFLKQGNSVFISADAISEAFFDSLLMPEKAAFEDGFEFTGHIGCIKYTPKIMNAHFKKQTMAVYEKRFFKIISMDASYIPFRYLNNTEIQSGTEVLGKIKVDNRDEFYNYGSFKVGPGTLYLHTSPLVFSNYYLRTEWGFNYTNAALKPISTNKIFWQVNTQIVPEFFDNPEGNRRDNPFSVLLSFKSFRYAWYAFLLAILTFCLYGFKRKQRPIPVISQKSNTSLEFAGTIAKLYLAGKNHKPIAMQKYHYFFAHVRSKYGIDLKSKDKGVLKQLSDASRVPLEHIEDIMRRYEDLNFSLELKSKDLHILVNAINTFYDKS